ncbi:aspartyl-phosphate phosphatase Spo0E family protein [Desulfitobacterium sp. Sab5]|uniref:aspartyl-phosphate phosphatase Spo0E family protein n=1 Tax=Desulfitobacterium nosdiversum TaxID=3375356 RepID=UPI003CF4236C
MVRKIALKRILIEETRRELLSLGNSKTLTDPEVVRLSQQLDRLLNEYETLTSDYLYRLQNKEACQDENNL